MIDKVEQQDLDNFVNLIRFETKRESTEAWIILIDGKRFCTDKGKSVWKKQNHATSALRNAVSHSAKGVILKKLYDLGIDKSDPMVKYKCDIYNNAYDIMLQMLKDQNRIQIIKLS